MRKKALLIAMCLCMAVLPVGCGNDAESENGQKNVTGTITPTASADNSSEENESAGTITPTASANNSSEENESAGTITPTVLEQKYIDGVTLGTYFGIEVEAATQEEIDQYIEDARAAHVERVAVTDRAVKNGDITIIDYAGFKGEEQFEGGTAEKQELVIGSGQFIDGFEEGLIGAEIGKEVSLNLKFPDDYPSADVAGADVVFKVTVKEIYEEVLPEFNDAFVQKISEYETTEEYRAFVEEDITMQKKYYTVKDEIIASAQFALYPEESIANTADSMRNEYAMYASYYSMDYDTFVSAAFGMTAEQFDAQIEAFAKEIEEERMVFLKIAEAENLVLSDELYQEKAIGLATYYGFETIEEFEAAYTKPVIEESLMLEYALDTCVENAIVIK